MKSVELATNTEQVYLRAAHLRLGRTKLNSRFSVSHGQQAAETDRPTPTVGWVDECADSAAPRPAAFPSGPACAHARMRNREPALRAACGARPRGLGLLGSSAHVLGHAHNRRRGQHI